MIGTAPPAPSPDSIECEILGLVTEDRFGLWEVGAVVGRLLPDADRPAALRAARAAALALLRQGLVEVTDAQGGAAHDPEAALDDPDNWVHELAAENRPKLAATPAGEALYFEGMGERPAP